MRIVHVVSGYLPRETGGVQIHVRDLCRVLQARGHSVEVFTRTAGAEHPELSLSRSTWEDIPVTAITNNFADFDRFELLYSHPGIDARFAAYLDETKPDLVHVHHLTCLSTTMVDVTHRRGIPVVFSLHDYWMMCPRGQRIHPQDLQVCEPLDRARCAPCLHRLWPHLLPDAGDASWLRRLLGRDTTRAKLRAWEKHAQGVLESCEALTAPSRFHAERFVEWGVDHRNLFVVPYGLDHPALIDAPRGNRPVQNIGFIGTVLPSKGVHVLCDAFRRLPGSGLTLHVYGDTPPYHEDTSYLDRLQATLPSGLDVRFHGRYEQRDLPSIFAGLDLLVVPSLWWESYCLVAHEGALAGLPVVASRIGALEEAVDAGLFVGFRPGDANDLAAAIRHLIEDVDLRDRMTSKAGLVRNLMTSVTETERVYDRAVTNSADPQQATGSRVQAIGEARAEPDTDQHLAAAHDASKPTTRSTKE